MKLFKILCWGLLLGYWIYKIYTNDLIVRSNTMYYVAIVVSVAGLAKSIYDYKLDQNKKENLE
jgi:hypothetical protein